MKKQNIALITTPISHTLAISNLVDILYSMSSSLYLVTGDAGYNFFKDDRRINIHGVRHESGKNVISRVTNHTYIQIKISQILIKLARNIDICVFFVGGEELLLPILIARLFRKKVVLALAGFPAKGGQVRKDPLNKAADFLSETNLILSNRIIVYSERIVEERNLKKHKNKILIAGEHFLDFNNFKVKKQLSERNNIIGYIGSLSKIKGILNFVHAIPKMLENEKNIEFLIGGDGELRSKVEEYSRQDLKVKFIGWISHDELPKYLNELKLLVLPSYTEGLPNIMLEAMACDTPVLATPVGAIPDVIRDGKTGFIMEDNSPECIAENIKRVLNNPNLNEITNNARKLVEKKFTYEAALAKYRKIIENI